MYQHPKARKGTSHVNVKSTNTTRVELKKKIRSFHKYGLDIPSSRARGMCILPAGVWG